MNIGIYYFSGTGNTRWIASRMKDRLLQQGNNVVCDSIEDDPTIENLDLIIIGGPIYAGNMPEMLIRWVLRQVPDSATTKAIVFSTSAGLDNANGVNSIGKKLQKKGYDIRGLLTYVMPRNFYLDKYEQTTKENAKIQFTDALELVVIDLDDISKHIDVNDKVFGMDMLAEVMSIMTRFMGRSFSASETCTSCRKCETNCPTHNIKVSEGVKWGFKCMMCTRCIHQCPVNAIQYKGKTVEQYSVTE